MGLSLLGNYKYCFNLSQYTNATIPHPSYTATGRYIYIFPELPCLMDWLYMYIWRFRARQHLRSLVPVMKMTDDDNDGQMIFGDLGGLKIPNICLTGEETPPPKKTSPRKLVLTGDRTRARCVTCTLATDWPTLWTDSHNYLISSVIHFHVISIYINVLIGIVEYCCRTRVPGIASHVISHHQNYLAIKQINTFSIRNESYIHDIINKLWLLHITWISQRSETFPALIIEKFSRFQPGQHFSDPDGFPRTCYWW